MAATRFMWELLVCESLSFVMRPGVARDEAMEFPSLLEVRELMLARGDGGPPLQSSVFRIRYPAVLEFPR